MGDLPIVVLQSVMNVILIIQVVVIFSENNGLLQNATKMYMEGN